MDRPHSTSKLETTNQIPRRLVLGIIILFFTSLIVSGALAIWSPNLAWLPFVFFLFLFGSVAIIYFIRKINQSMVLKQKEELRILRDKEKTLLETINKKVSEIINKELEGHNG
ncbi:MAG: hypothetical protein J0M11_18410 [Anaerolineae bacterium]|nr:hypothetical protein [Anaerolineae bacterium]